MPGTVGVNESVWNEPSACTETEPLQIGVPLHAIAAWLVNGPYRSTTTVTGVPPRLPTVSRSNIGVPAATLSELTCVVKLGCVCAKKRSAGSSHRDLTPAFVL